MFLRQLTICLLSFYGSQALSAQPKQAAPTEVNRSLITVPDSTIFKAGAALRIITPNPLLPVSGGVGKPNPATLKKGDLSVRALVFEKGNTRIAIVSVDNLGWSSVLGNRSRALIKGILPENILIGATP